MPFAPTPGEVALVNQIFLRGDTQKLNALTGDKAIGVFKAANLPEATLGDIWAIGDPENNGFLTRAGCAKVVRLIGWAQQGEVNIGDHLLEKVGPLAVLEGYAPPAAQSAPIPRLPTQISTIAPLPPLTPQDRQKFLGLFNGRGPVAGYLSGEKARELFIRSKLPVERLNAIWNLADRENRGSLDSTEFVIAMYFIQGSMGNPPPIPILPPSLPPFLVYAAADRPIQPIAAHQTGSSLHSPTFPSATSTILPQYTGSTTSALRPGAISPQMTGRPVSAAPSRIPPAIPARPSTIAAIPPAVPGQSPFPLARPPAHVQPTVVPWEVQPAERATSDGYFQELDQQGLGYVEGAAAVPFMLLSNLPDATLARVWDLADMKNDGRLTEESFAVAMHLINQVLTGKLLPDTLPVSLVPPSFRSELGMPPAVQQGPVVSETQKDLFDLFGEAAPTSAPVQSQYTGSTAFQPQYTGAASSTLPNFGTFPMHMPVPAPAPAPQGPVKDLLGDDDEVIERTTHQISSTSAEIGNTQDQLNQITTAYESAKTEREKLEAELASHAATLSQLQTQLASSKAGHEAESKLLATLRERYNAQLAEIQTTRTQLITAESDLSALKLEKTEVGGALLRDKEEVRELQRRHKDVLEEVEDVKKDVEKAKKDVRLQKGLLAIAKKQLASAEGDKAAAEKELKEAEKEAESAESELKVAELELALRPQSPSLGAAEMPGPAPDGTKTPSVRATSPVPSIRSATSHILAPTATLPFQDAASTGIGGPGSSKSNNPFERLALSRSNSKSPFQAASPPPAQPSTIPSAEDDDPFGFNAVPSTATITPVETVSPQNTGGMGVPTPESDITVNVNINHAPQASFTESDAYFTPPSSTETERKDTQDVIVAAALSQFPDLTEPGVPAPPVTANPTDDVDEPIDINLPPLTEIKEADDSSDDSDEDEADFEAARTAVKAEVSPAPASSPPPVAQPRAESQPQLQPPAPVNAGAAAFDDLFKVSPATSNAATTAGSDFSNISANPQQAPVAQNGSAFPTDNFFDSMTSAATPAPTNGATSAASTFDDIMGTGANAQGPPNDAPFKFDKAFDEPFDFNSFSTSDPSQVLRAPQAATNEASAFPATGPPTALSFDDAFGTSDITPDKGKQAQPLSFDDAFDIGSVVPEPQPRAVVQALAQQQQPTPAFPMPELPFVSTITPTIQVPTPKQHQETPSVAPTTPTAPSSQAPVSIRSASPTPTQQSTKERMQRAASPKPRSSGGSGRPSGSQSEPPPPKHSRFSLFGRSKIKKEKEKGGKEKGRGGDIPPIPARLVGDRGDTPAQDDLDAVKQLCGMGFSRHQAVEALEKHDYNFTAALNSLLGT